MPTSVRADSLIRADANGKIYPSTLPDIPSNKVEGFEALENRIGSFGIAATEFGVSTSNADNTAALEALATTHQSPYIRKYIHLPPGTIRGHIPMAPGITWVMNGTEVKFPTSGPAKPMVYPLDPDWWGADDLTGPHRSGMIGDGVLNGQSYSWGIWPMAQPAKPSVTPTGLGSLTAGTYKYRLAYKTAFGQTRPSAEAEVTLTSTGRVNLSWSNPADASDKEVVIYGRGASVQTQRVLATLPAGSTAFVDDGTVTPSGAAAQPIDTSAPSALFCGAIVRVEGIEIKSMPGTGAVFRFEGAQPANEYGRNPASLIKDCVIQQTGGEGLIVCGPQHTKVENVSIRYAGKHSPSDAKQARSGVMTVDYGPIYVDGVEVDGYCRWGVESYTSVNLTDSRLGGGIDGQVGLFGDSEAHNVVVRNPQSPYSVGFKVGESWYSAKCLATGIRAEGFSSSTGAAIDLRDAAEPSRVSGLVKQNSGTAVAGQDKCWHDFSIDGTVTGYTSIPVARVQENNPVTVGFSDLAEIRADDFANHSLALQEAFNRAATVRGKVLLMGGSYLLPAGLNVPDNVRVEAASRKVILSGNADTGTSHLLTLGVGSEFIGGRVQGGNNYSGLKAAGSHSVIRGVIFDGMTKTGVTVGGGGANGYHITVDDCHVTGSGSGSRGFLIAGNTAYARLDKISSQDIEEGLHVDGSSAKITEATMSSNSNYGYNIGGSKTQLVGCMAETAGVSGFFMTGSFVRLSDAIASYCSTRGFELSSGAGSLVSGSLAESCGTSYRVSPGASSWTFSDCRSADYRTVKSTQTGWDIYGPYGTLRDCVAPSGEHTGDGIYISPSVSATVSKIDTNPA